MKVDKLVSNKCFHLQPHKLNTFAFIEVAVDKNHTLSTCISESHLKSLKSNIAPSHDPVQKVGEENLDTSLSQHLNYCVRKRITSIKSIVTLILVNSILFTQQRDNRNIWGKVIAMEGRSKIETRTHATSSSFGQNVFFKILRGGGQVSNEIKSKQLVLSAPESFLSLEEIGSMSLADLSDLIEYSVNVNRCGFDKKSFLSKFSSRMKKNIYVLDAACAKSRGEGVLPAETMAESLKAESFGNVDASQFCAAMRIFAEWRVLRQVPAGNKGYTVCMNAGRKDVVQNLVKVENAMFAWIERERERERKNMKDNPKSNRKISMKNSHYFVPRGPTLHDLLQHEIDFEVHKGKLPRLVEKSAAMGLLWVRRQLQYQTEIFKKVRSEKYPDAPTAVSAAYTEIYGNYHSGMIQKIFNYSFKVAPSVKEIYKVMNPEYLKTVTEGAKNHPSTNEDMNNETNDEYNESNSYQEQIRRNGFRRVKSLERLRNLRIAQPFHKAKNKSLESDMDERIKLQAYQRKNEKSQNGDLDPKKAEYLHERKELEGESLQKYINDHMKMKALEHMGCYLRVVNPILKDLDELFHKMNMNDPTRV